MPPSLSGEPSGSSPFARRRRGDKTTEEAGRLGKRRSATPKSYRRRNVIEAQFHLEFSRTYVLNIYNIIQTFSDVDTLRA